MAPIDTRFRAIHHSITCGTFGVYVKPCIEKKSLMGVFDSILLLTSVENLAGRIKDF